MRSKAFSSQYEKLFPDEHSKAEVFDEIAKMYYFGNFGTTPKAEVDLLMFSAYLERIFGTVNISEGDYSDYTLAKNLGITQGRVRTLKERKEIKYPSNYSWGEEFLKVLSKAEYTEGKVRIYISDQRLYTELDNQIHLLGSYSEATLTRQLLVVSPFVFVDLMVEASPEETENVKMREKLQEILAGNQLDADMYVQKKLSFREALKDQTADILQGVLSSVIEQLPIVGPITVKAADGIFKAIQKSIESRMENKKFDGRK